MGTAPLSREKKVRAHKSGVRVDAVVRDGRGGSASFVLCCATPYRSALHAKLRPPYLPLTPPSIRILVSPTFGVRCSAAPTLAPDARANELVQSRHGEGLPSEPGLRRAMATDRQLE